MSINKHIIYTAILIVFSTVLFALSDIDIFIQDYFFNYQTHQWILDRELQPYKFIFYDGIKKVLILIAVSFLIALIFFRNTTLIKEYKQGIIIVILSAILIPVMIGGLKKSTNMPCPKNEIHYGGKMPKTALWQRYDEPYKSMDKIKCWPAGHASGGFALLSLFFLFKSKKHKTIALIGALGIGWSMGIYKMLIGDHFFSHTLITMLIAWFIVVLIYKYSHKGVAHAKTN